MFEHGFPKHWSTLKKFVWLIGSGVIGGASGIWKTVTGTLIHITDALASPMQKCEVTLEPIQDLHGQNAPYPAGGSSNIWDEEWEVGLVDASSGQNTPNNNYSRTKNYIPVDADTSYYLVFPSGVTLYLRFYDAEKNYLGYLQKDSAAAITPSQVSASFATAAYLRFCWDGQIYNNNIAINYPSTDHSYHPYSNICPITGWTGCEVNVTGVNVWDEQWELGTINTTTGVDEVNTTRIRTSYIPVIPNTEYFFYMGASIGNGRSVWYDSNKNFISGNINTPYAILESPANAHYLRVSPPSGYGTTYNNNISINFPSTDRTYHAYQGTTLSVTFPDGQTVYGGTVDLVSGVLTVDRAKIVLNGTQEIFISNWRATSTSVGWIYRYNITNNKIYSRDQDVPNILCSTLETASYGNVYYGTVDNAVTTQGGVTPTGGICIRVGDQSLTNNTAINNYLSANPIEIVYELAEPIEIQLTPQEISTLKGENNIWSNTNGDTTIIYKAQSS